MYIRVTFNDFCNMFFSYMPVSEHAFCLESLKIIYESLEDKVWLSAIDPSEVYDEFRLYTARELVSVFLKAPKDLDDECASNLTINYILMSRKGSVWKLSDSEFYLVRDYSMIERRLHK